MSCPTMAQVPQMSKTYQNWVVEWQQSVYGTVVPFESGALLERRHEESSQAWARWEALREGAVGVKGSNTFSPSPTPKPKRH